MQWKVVGFVPACVFGFAAAIGILFAASLAARRPRTDWDTTAGTMTGGNGTWDPATTPSWSLTTGGDHPLSTSTALSNAESGTGFGMVAVNGNPSVNNIAFDAGTGYTLGGTGTLTVSAAASPPTATPRSAASLAAAASSSSGTGQLAWNSTSNPVVNHSTFEVAAGTLAVGAGVATAGNGIFTDQQNDTWQVDSARS